MAVHLLKISFLSLVLVTTLVVIYQFTDQLTNEYQISYLSGRIDSNISVPSDFSSVVTYTGSDTALVNVTAVPSVRTILYWGTWYDVPWSIPKWITCSNGYKCRQTTNENECGISDAIVYHGRSKVRSFAPLNSRPKDQIWVYYNQESPRETFHYPRHSHVINWTATYVRTSDIKVLYGRIVPGKFNEGFDPTKNYLEGKNRSAIALISNCKAASGRQRLKYVKKLSKYIDVDIFGGCGKGRCDNCMEKIRLYKFYLAFENAYCVDYITEKFYVNGLQHGAVPVVISGANLSSPEVAPPGSFIDATKFSSAKSLAEYLRTESSDAKHYNKYFQWYSRYKVQLWGDWACDVCVLLHQEKKPHKSYNSIKDWYTSTAGRCFKYPTIFSPWLSFSSSFWHISPSPYWIITTVIWDTWNLRL